MDKQWHYLELSSGRLLCELHGGFCDERDGHAQTCPVCKDEGDEISSNNVHRTLKVINGLQDRSKRGVGLVASLVGGLGLLTVLQKLRTVPSEAAFIENMFAYGGAVAVFKLGIVALLAAIAFYAASMGHISVTEGGAFPKKTYSNWEIFLGGRLRRFEMFHSIAGFCLVLGIALFALMILATFCQVGK